MIYIAEVIERLLWLQRFRWKIIVLFTWPGCETKSGSIIDDIFLLHTPDLVVKPSQVWHTLWMYLSWHVTLWNAACLQTWMLSFHSKPHLRNRVWLAHALGIVFFVINFDLSMSMCEYVAYGMYKVCPGRDIRAFTFFFLLPVLFLRVTQVLCCFCWLIIVLNIVNCLAQDWPVGKQGQPKGYDGV